MSTVPDKPPLQDPWNTPVGKSLLDCKHRLNEILKQLQPTLDPEEILKDNMESHMKELDKIRTIMEKIINNARNKPVLEQCLKSTVAVMIKAAEARSRLWAAMPLVRTVHSSTASPAEKWESGVVLDKALEACRSSLREAISQFRK